MEYDYDNYEKLMGIVKKYPKAGDNSSFDNINELSSRNLI